MTTRPHNRRHSFSFFGVQRPHQHKSIPLSATSHPDNPIPVEPGEARRLTISPQMRRDFNKDTSPRSSGDSLSAVSDETSDSDAPSMTESHQDVGEIADSLRELPTSKAQKPPKRRASMTHATNSEEIRRLLGNGGGTKFLQKYCCGDGCCMVEALPAANGQPEHVFIQPPDNAAYRFLGLNLGSLTLNTELTKIVDLPERKTTFGPLRRTSITAKFPRETDHAHDAAAVNVYPPTYMQPHPPYSIFNAPVYGARELTKPGAEKRTFHFDLDVTDYPAEGGVDFKVGGAVGVCPPNDPAVVEDIMDRLGLPRFQRDKPIRLFTSEGRWPTIWGDDAARELVTTRRELLTWTVDISSAPPTKPLFRLLSDHASAPNEKHILRFLASAQGQAAFCDLRTGPPHITLQQLLHAFPSTHPPLEALCPLLNQLMPRFYSLSNDPHVSSAREGLAGRRLIEIAVTIHSTPSFTGQARTGVGSGFLERIAAQFLHAESTEPHSGRNLDLRVPMFRGLMANPLSREFASDGPMVLIGAGVGMAPFRGFILNRLKNANCANKIWLIQGIRDSMLDEIYKGELGANEGSIKKVVQSRGIRPPPVSTADPDVEAPPTSSGKPAKIVGGSQKAVGKEEKVARYVQDEVRLQADVVWFAINAVDGRIFVCGSTKGMGEGVEGALIDVAMDKGGLDEETAREFWREKKRGGQYVAETW